MQHHEIEDRIVEAAEIERRMPNGGERPIGYKGSWPAFMYTFADRVGWDQDRHKEDRDARTMVAASVSRQEHDRWLEVRRWIVELLDNPAERRALSAWAISAAGGRPFAKWCRNVEHIARQTGYRRVSRAIETLHLALKPVSNEPLSENGVLHIEAKSRIPDGTLERAAPILNWIADDAHPADHPEHRDLSWSAKQNERRARRKAPEVA